MFGRVIPLDILYRRPFSPETRARYPDRGYVGKKLHYFGIKFLGTDADICLGEELSAWRRMSREDLLRTVKYAAELPPVLDGIEREVFHDDILGSVYVPGLQQPLIRRTRNIGVRVVEK